MPKITGIYKITNTINNKVYIGRAVHINDRWNSHKTNLKNNKHCNSILQAAWNKYGNHAFIFEIIEKINTIGKIYKELDQLLEERENYWLNYYKSYERDKGYNLYKTCGSRLGISHDEKTKEKISKHHIQWYKDNPDKKLFGINNVTSIPIRYYDITGKFIQEFESVSLAGAALNINPNNITNSAKKKFKPQLPIGYFRYKKEYENILQLSIEELSFNSISILKYDTNGNFIEELPCLFKLYTNSKERKKLHATIGRIQRKKDFYYIYKLSDEYPKQIVTIPILRKTENLIEQAKQKLKITQNKIDTIIEALKPREHKILQYDKNGNLIGKWKSFKDIKEQLNITVSLAPDLPLTHAGGFLWGPAK